MPMNTQEQDYLKALEKKLWTAADKLRSTLDAAQYKHAVLGLIFVKYVSDAFDARRKEIEVQLTDAEHAYYLDPADFNEDELLEEIHAGKEIEKHDFVLAPGRYVGVTEEDEGIPFGEKMANFTAKLSEQFAESAKLEIEIKKNLAGLGYVL